MGVHLDSQTTAYIIHDRRTLSGEDAVYKTAVELTNDVMNGLGRLTHSHSLMAATLIITDRGAQLILLTKSFEMESMNNAMESTLKSITYDPSTGNLYTYVIPILEVISGENISIDGDNLDVTSMDRN